MVKLLTFIGKFLSLRPKNFRCPRIVLSFQNVLLALAILAIPVFGYYLWRVNTAVPGLDDFFRKFPTKMGQEVSDELRSAPALAFKQDGDTYTVTDDDSTGIKVEYPNRPKGDEQNESDPSKNVLKLSFPNDYSKPLEVDLGQGKKFTLTDQGAAKGYRSELLDSSLSQNGQGSILDIFTRKRAEEMRSQLKSDQSPVRDILSYRSTDSRKTILYSYRNDGASRAKKLKNWTIYAKGSGSEEEKYVLDGATAKINDSGDLDIFLKSEQDIKNEAATAQVSPSLLERAKKTLEKENGSGAMDGNRPADLTIPKPYFVDKDGNHHGADWTVSDDGKTISVSIKDAAGLYPIALDPTLSFSAPGMGNTGDVITGEGVNNEFGVSLVAGDFNFDGKTDLAVGARLNTAGRVYIFYNDGSVSAAAATADVVIVGENNSDYFGYRLFSGDFNSDGRVDLVASATGYVSNNNSGRVYIFYNDGSIPTTAAAADVKITEVSSQNFFGASFAAGDFNADGRTDLVVSAWGALSYDGRVYIFYNDGSYPSAASSADVIIAGESSSYYFGSFLTSGDFDSDGRTDLAVSAIGYGTNTGRVYIFYNDGSIPTTAATADVKIDGESSSNRFGSVLASGDFNSDGRMDFAVGAFGYGTTGRTYIFYNDGSIPTTAAAADVKIDGESYTEFGAALTSADLNQDGRADLVVTSTHYLSDDKGRTYVFYNDGSYPTAATSADVIITGEVGSSKFGSTVLPGDFNADGKTDLVVGAYQYGSSTGRTYIFYSQNGTVNTNASISGTTTNQALGRAMASGDLNQDGRTDLVVADENCDIYIFNNDGSYPSTTAGADVTMNSACGNSDANALAVGDFNSDGKLDIAVGENDYGTQTGRVTILYNDGSWPSGTNSADVTITNSTTYELFGNSLVTGDFNADGKTDLAVSSYGYSAGAGTGRVYVFFQSTSWPSAASSANAILTGSATNDNFGGGANEMYAMAAGDFNADGKTDLAVGAPGEYTSGKSGHAYVFYNGSISTKNASSANIVLTGNASELFGSSVAMGDFNSDGKTDLAVGAGYEGDGYAHIFYSLGSSNPSTWAASASDVTISGLSPYHEPRLLAGDFNADGRTDLVATNLTYNGSLSYYYTETWVFYNDGSYPTSAASADIIISSAATDGSGFYDTALVAGDFNSDGRMDFAIGEAGAGTNGVGQINFYTARENFAWQTHVSGPPGGMNVTSGAGQEVRIVGETVPYEFGDSMVAGDFNADGKMDLAVGTPYFSSQGTPNGRVYIFYDDGSIPSAASSADAVITGSGNYSFDYFGWNLSVGDLNADGKTDLVAAGLDHVWIFYNKGTGKYPDVVSGADLDIAGTRGSAGSIVTGDFNADGRADLAIGDAGGGTDGRACIFFFDGSVPVTLDTADVILSGENPNGVQFGISLTVGDFNADGKTDLAVSDIRYNGSDGRVYLFYNGSITTKNASAANDIIDTVNTNMYFGGGLVAGDFNADGKTDLLATEAGYIYVFHNNGTGAYPANNGSANATIAMTTDLTSIVAGDFNGDGKTDIAVTNATAALIFYNDGSYPAADTAADLGIFGVVSTSGDAWPTTLMSGDFNADGRTDLAISNPGATVNGVADAGSVGIYTFNDATLTGAAGSKFGYAMTAGDFNADGRTDLAVGAPSYSSNTGRVYMFYNDGSLVSDLTVSSADSVITGGTAGDLFGGTLVVGDFNADGKKDIAISAEGYSAGAGPGRMYLFYQDSAGGFNASIAVASANSIITEDQYEGLGHVATVGDFNSDGKDDLAISVTGGTYGHIRIFYQNSAGGFNAGLNGSAANSVITGEANSYFSTALETGDFNSDGKADIVAVATAYSSYSGRVYMFYQNTAGGFDASILAASANAKITGEMSGSYFGGGGQSNETGLAVGDFNQDGKTDFAAGAHGYNSYEGRAYIFFQDSGGGFSATSAASADVIIASETAFFGLRLAAGDLNADGRRDLVIGKYDYSKTRTFVYYNDGSWQMSSGAADAIIEGSGDEGQSEAPSYAVGDFNADGKTDLAIGADNYNSDAGHVSVVLTEASTAENQPAARTRGTVKVRGSMKVR